MAMAVPAFIWRASIACRRESNRLRLRKGVSQKGALLERLLFQHVVGKRKESGWKGKAKHRRGLEIEDQPEPRWLFDGEIGRF